MFSTKKVFAFLHNYISLHFKFSFLWLNNYYIVIFFFQRDSKAECVCNELRQVAAEVKEELELIEALKAKTAETESAMLDTQSELAKVSAETTSHLFCSISWLSLSLFLPIHTNLPETLEFQILNYHFTRGTIFFSYLFRSFLSFSLYFLSFLSLLISLQTLITKNSLFFFSCTWFV